MTARFLKRNEITLNKKKDRIWEIDFLRGICILLVVFDHFMFDMMDFIPKSDLSTAAGLALKDFAKAYYNGGNLFGHMRGYLWTFFLVMFCVLSGISSAFAKNNFIRGLKLAGVAGGLSLGVFVLNKLGVGFFVGESITFNVLHVLALSILLYAVLEKIKAPLWAVFIPAVIMIMVGLEFLHYPADNLGKWFFWVVESKGYKAYSSLDYMPFLPFGGWFMLGAFFSKILYKEKISLFPNAKTAIIKPIMFCGRFSLTIYIGGQVLTVLILIALTQWLHWL